MRWEWPGRWTGAACAVAGCMPMLFALVAGTAGAAGANSMMMMTITPVDGATPAWVTLLGDLSWPLLLASALLLVWSFWRTRREARAVAYLGVAGLLANQFHMTPWVFFPALALVAAGFALARAARGRAAAAGATG